MTAPKSLGAYKECEEYFEQALGTEGIAITLPSPKETTRLAHKMNTYRSLLRKKNKDIYPEGHNLHGMSPYDSYQVTKDPEDPCRLLIREYKTTVVKVERL